MSTSGSWDYSLTAANIIDMALENLHEIAEGETASSAQSTTMLRRLNVLAKQYQGESDGLPGVKVHTRQRITMLLAKGQQTYLVGPASTDARSSTQVGRTTVATAYVSGTSLVVASNTDTTSYPGTTITMANSDFIGVELDNGTIGWTTISSVAGAPTITLAAGLGGAAAVGRYVWWFTSRAQRFPILESARLRDQNRLDTPLAVYTDAAQYDLGVVDKFADGDPTEVLVEPLRIATRLTFNTQPTDVTKTVEMTVLYPAEDYDSSSDDIAFPQEALRFLAWELSFECHPLFGVAWTDGMEKNRMEARAMWSALNPENSTLYFMPGGN